MKARLIPSLSTVADLHGAVTEDIWKKNHKIKTNHVGPQHSHESFKYIQNAMLSDCCYVSFRGVFATNVTKFIAKRQKVQQKRLHSNKTLSEPSRKNFWSYEHAERTKGRIG